MSDIHIRETAVTMNMVDGDVLTPAQMARLVAAVLAELRRQDEDRRRRHEDTVITGSSARGSDGRPQ